MFYILCSACLSNKLMLLTSPNISQAMLQRGRRHTSGIENTASPHTQSAER